MWACLLGERPLEGIPVEQISTRTSPAIVAQVSTAEMVFRFWAITRSRTGRPFTRPGRLAGKPRSPPAADAFPGRDRRRPVGGRVPSLSGGSGARYCTVTWPLVLSLRSRMGAAVQGVGSPRNEKLI